MARKLPVVIGLHFPLHCGGALVAISLSPVVLGDVSSRQHGIVYTYTSRPFVRKSTLTTR